MRLLSRPHRSDCTDAATGLNTAIGTELTHGSYPVHYSFMRGAGRQYGVPWWSSVAEFTHFGYKRQDCEQASGLPNSSNPCNDAACQHATSVQSTGGATCGTSYSLFKRSLFACVLYDSAFCGAADEQGRN